LTERKRGSVPELPEVETIKSGLQKVITGKMIKKFESLDSKVVRFKSINIGNTHIKNIERRVKMLIINLDNGKSLLIHLKLTGQLIWKKSKNNEFPNKFTRAFFNLGDGSRLYFNDLRRFGYIKLYETNELINVPELKKLGPEPLGEKFKSQIPNLKIIIKNSKKPIKNLLMDQTFIAGIGNIYADEILFYAGILPNRKANRLDNDEIEKIFAAIPVILKRGIKYGGTSVDAYLNAFGKEGEMAQYLMVYRKTGKSCRKCGTKVKRITLGGRGTHFCERCQK